LVSLKHHQDEPSELNSSCALLSSLVVVAAAVAWLATTASSSYSACYPSSHCRPIRAKRT
jgi:hypothetical protein